ncbi:hypothetical protein HHI36_012569 [Cryptolaemus montrouzieri]|uniref:Uncharacterized protein n=1 Tax=Cryptolaemus montrouzieri TaxID=559131 RepID=A0ABD2NFJ3_9CUCU
MFEFVRFVCCIHFYYIILSPLLFHSYFLSLCHSLFFRATICCFSSFLLRHLRFLLFSITFSANFLLCSSRSLLIIVLAFFSFACICLFHTDLICIVVFFPVFSSSFHLKFYSLFFLSSLQLLLILTFISVVMMFCDIFHTIHMYRIISSWYKILFSLNNSISLEIFLDVLYLVRLAIFSVIKFARTSRWPLPVLHEFRAITSVISCLEEENMRSIPFFVFPSGLNHVHFICGFLFRIMYSWHIVSVVPKSWQAYVLSHFFLQVRAFKYILHFPFFVALS